MKRLVELELEVRMCFFTGPSSTGARKQRDYIDTAGEERREVGRQDMGVGTQTT